MDTLAQNPVLGHITTFGGHPVCCAAGMAAFKVLLEEKITDSVTQKEQRFLSQLKSDKIRDISSFGLWMALKFDTFEIAKSVIDDCIADGVLTDWFLFASDCLRISPPLVISDEQIDQACSVIVKAINSK